MSSNNLRFLDYEILKEFWDKYQLSDGTQIKTRAILTEVRRMPKGNGFEYTCGFQGLRSILLSPESRGSPSEGQLTKERVRDSIWNDMRYDIISEEWSEYLTDDGTRIRLKSTVTQIRKSSLYQPNGDPIYDVRMNILPQITPRKI